MGVSNNLIEARWIALVRAVRVETLRAHEQQEGLIDIADDSWAV